jgi:hypothetical protein
MGYMKKLMAEELLASSEYELDPRYSILKKAVESAILDLDKAQAKGVYTQHRQVLAWTALRTLKQALENLNEEA